MENPETVDLDAILFSLWRDTDKPHDKRGDFAIRTEALNTSQVCRLVNDADPADIESCYVGQEFGKTDREHCCGRAFGSRLGIKNEPCVHVWWHVRTRLMLLEKKGLVTSEKVRARDRGGIGTDLFRFWRVNPEALKRHIQLWNEKNRIRPAMREWF